MNITFASISHQGKRSSNQDRLANALGARAACFVMCDGIAGEHGGDTAARLACDTIITQFDGDHHLDAQRIRGYIAAANHAIKQQQRNHDTLKNMGTTLVSLFIDRDYQLAYWAHAGDSRLYHFRRGYLLEMTRDHSLAQRMQDAGYPTDAINHNLLYFALGMKEEREASYSDVLALEDGDVFLLCTDGFWHEMDVSDLEQTLRMVSNPQEWLALLQRMKPHDNGDNFSAMAVWMGDPQESTLLSSLGDAQRILLSQRD
jgi:PPM family protein phosphatase